MSGHVNCDTCGQYQEITAEWLTCVFCGEILKVHPYFMETRRELNAIQTPRTKGRGAAWEKMAHTQGA